MILLSCQSSSTIGERGGIRTQCIHVCDDFDDGKLSFASENSLAIGYVMTVEAAS